MTDLPERTCTICAWRDVREPAEFVAENAEHVQWFECADHGPNDHDVCGPRTARTPIREWFERMPWYQDQRAP